MPTNETDTTNSPIQGIYQKYLVVAADMAAYNGHQINNYHLVMTYAESDEHTLETANSALEDGFLPLLAYLPADLHQLANELAARPLKPKESYNGSAGMMDLEFAGPDEEPETRASNE